MTDFVERPATAQSLACRKLIHGHGINDAKYIVAPIVDGKQQCCPYYSTWRDMLKRVYSPKHHAQNPTYADATLCREWRVFSAFRGWMRRRNWQGKALDKDLFFEGNKLYSPETCVFVTSRVNNVLMDCAAARGAWPLGVSLDKRCGRFRAKCNDGRREMWLGYFASPGDAHNAWRIAKSRVFLEVAAEQPDPRVRDALLKRAAILQGCPA